MGIGDCLMAAGEARHQHQKTGLPVLILDRRGRPTWSEMWEGLPYILRRPDHRAHTRMINAGGMRPYIAGKGPTAWTWRPYKPIPAEIVFMDPEMRFAEHYHGAVMIEPNGKAIGHDNKRWVKTRWQEVVDAMPGVRFVQCGSMGETHWLRNVERVVTPTFRIAAAVLSVCRAFVSTEGGLMHAAAAVGTPSVIIWSEFISPNITGYPGLTTMRNLRRAGTPCGSRLNCSGCRASMEAISVDEVVMNLRELL